MPPTRPIRPLDRHLTRRRVLATGATFAVPAALAAPSPVALAASAPAGFPSVILPKSRLLSYYGYPGNELMGILGEYAKEDLLPLLQDQAAAYSAADPETPLALAYEVIASVAQADAGDDGNFLVHIDSEILDDYADFCMENDLLLILDLQFGRDTVQDELAWLEPWLKLPHVHPALDPEFAIKEGEQPGVDLGSLDADDIAYAQRWLVDLAEKHDLPPKILIVHQFNVYTITNKDKIKPVDGLQFVLEVDGWGPPDEKRDTYRVLTEEPIEYHGFKLWYQQDDPLLTPDEVVALSPTPDVVIYQ